MRLVYEEPDAIRKSGPTGPDFRSSKPGLPRVPLLQQQAERELSQCCFKLTLPLLKRLKRRLGPQCLRPLSVRVSCLTGNYSYYPLESL